jgi:hypothetical protein
MGEQERVPTLVVVLSVVLSGLLGMQYTGTVHKDSSSLSNAFCSTLFRNWMHVYVTALCYTIKLDVWVNFLQNLCPNLCPGLSHEPLGCGQK